MGLDWNARARDGSSVNDLQAWDSHRHRTRFEPFTPEPRPAIRISASIIVKHANKCDSIFCVWRLPVLSHVQHIVTVSKQFLAAHDVLERYMSRISQHVVKHHEGGRSSKSGFAVKMRPGVLWKCANGNNESVDYIIERPRMIRNGDPHITCACGRDKIPFG